jgi:hypothetical protein
MLYLLLYKILKMTLQDFFTLLSNNTIPVLLFFIALPVLATIVGFIGGTKDHVAPYNYIYSVIIYLVSLPGIFAVGLNIYFFLFQRQDIMQTNLLLQVLPIAAMLITVLIIKNNILLAYVPGFDKISGLWLMLFAVLFFMWLLEKIQIVVFSMMPFQYLLGIFVLIFGGLYIGWKKVRG